MRLDQGLIGNYCLTALTELTNLTLVKMSTTPSSSKTVQPSHCIKPAIMLKAFKKDPVSVEVLEAWKRIILKCIGRRMRERLSNPEPQTNNLLNDLPRKTLARVMERMMTPRLKAATGTVKARLISQERNLSISELCRSFSRATTRSESSSSIRSAPPDHSRVA